MLGNNIKTIRESRKLGLNETARRAGISPSYLSDIEKGKKKNPSIKVLNKIADVLGVDVGLFSVPANTNQIKKFDKENSNLKDELEYFEKLDITNIDDAMKFILAQPLFMDFGGYDLNEMSEEEIMDLANDMLLAMKLSIEKKKRK